MDRLKLLSLATALIGVTSVELALVGAHVVTRRLAQRIGRDRIAPVRGAPVIAVAERPSYRVAA